MMMNTGAMTHFNHTTDGMMLVEDPAVVTDGSSLPSINHAGASAPLAEPCLQAHQPAEHQPQLEAASQWHPSAILSGMVERTVNGTIQLAWSDEFINDMLNPNFDDMLNPNFDGMTRTSKATAINAARQRKNPNNLRIRDYITNPDNVGKTIAQLTKELNTQGFTSARGGILRSNQVKRIFELYEIPLP